MEKEEIRIEAPFNIAGVTLVPIVKSSINCSQSKRRLSFLGTKQPVSIVVISPQARRAFRVNGEEISLEQLIKEVPDIKAVLEGV